MTFCAFEVNVGGISSGCVGFAIVCGIWEGGVAGSFLEGVCWYF